MTNTHRILLALALTCTLWASGIVQAIIPQAVPTANKQGNSTKFMLAGTVAGATTPLCTDINGNATTTGCSGGSFGGFSSVFSSQSQAFVPGANIEWEATTNWIFTAADTSHITEMIQVATGTTAAFLRTRSIVVSTNPNVAFTVWVNSDDAVNSASIALAYACLADGVAVDNPSFTSLTAMTLAAIPSTSKAYQSSQAVTCTGTTAAPARLVVKWTATAPSAGHLNIIGLASPVL